MKKVHTNEKKKLHKHQKYVYGGISVTSLGAVISSIIVPITQEQKYEQKLSENHLLGGNSMMTQEQEKKLDDIYALIITVKNILVPELQSLIKIIDNNVKIITLQQGVNSQKITRIQADLQNAKLEIEKISAKVGA